MYLKYNLSLTVRTIKKRLLYNQQKCYFLNCIKNILCKGLLNSYLLQHVFFVVYEISDMISSVRLSFFPNIVMTKLLFFIIINLKKVQLRTNLIPYTSEVRIFYGLVYHFPNYFDQTPCLSYIKFIYTACLFNTIELPICNIIYIELQLIYYLMQEPWKCHSNICAPKIIPTSI